MVKLKGYFNAKTINVFATENKIKNVLFSFRICGAITRISSRITSLCRHSTKYAKVKKTTILILCSFVFSPLRIHSLVLRLNTSNLTIYGHVAGNLHFLITCNFTQFYPIEMGFSL